MAETKTDPLHYSALDPEPIEAMKGWMTVEEYRGYLKGSILKYLSRAGKKVSESELDDLRKAKWFMDRLVDSLEDTEVNLDDLSQQSQRLGGYSETTTVTPIRKVPRWPDRPAPDDWVLAW